MQFLDIVQGPSLDRTRALTFNLKVPLPPPPPTVTKQMFSNSPSLPPCAQNEIAFFLCLRLCAHLVPVTDTRQTGYDSFSGEHVLGATVPQRRCNAGPFPTLDRSLADMSNSLHFRQQVLGLYIRTTFCALQESLYGIHTLSALQKC